MKVLLLYLKQRFKPTIFAGLTLFLILFAVPHPFSKINAIVFVLPVFVFLGILRLYDDLMSYQVDASKPHRIYTHKESRNLLALILAGFTLFCLIVLFFLHPIVAGIAAVFLMLNDILYRLLFDKGYSRYFLPLIKYPVIVLLLYYLNSIEFSWLIGLCLMISVFFAFICFEVLDDVSFPVPDNLLYLCGNSSVAALIIGLGSLELWWVSVLILIIGNLIIHFKNKRTAYFFLGFVLMSKLLLEILV